MIYLHQEIHIKSTDISVSSADKKGQLRTASLTNSNSSKGNKGRVALHLSFDEAYFKIVVDRHKNATFFCSVSMYGQSMVLVAGALWLLGSWSSAL